MIAPERTTISMQRRGNAAAPMGHMCFGRATLRPDRSILYGRTRVTDSSLKSHALFDTHKPMKIHTTRIPSCAKYETILTIRPFLVGSTHY